MFNNIRKVRELVTNVVRETTQLLLELLLPDKDNSETTETNETDNDNPTGEGSTD